jgi:8-oxo-dGTP pyrophosphatase MutT (NUDIX family)
MPAMQSEFPPLRANRAAADGLADRLLAQVRRALSPVPALASLPKEFQPTAYGDHALNPGARPSSAKPLVPAAVLVALVQSAGELRVLFTRRTDAVSHHAGQISFPGGRVEPGDADPAACALRESAEEIGLQPRFVEIIGALDPYVTVTGFAVAPVVGVVRPGFALTLDQREVAETFEVPLAFLLDAGNHRRQRAVFNGVEREWWAIPYRGHYIWGATAGMVRNLYQRYQDRR